MTAVILLHLLGRKHLMVCAFVHLRQVKGSNVNIWSYSTVVNLLQLLVTVGSHHL